MRLFIVEFSCYNPDTDLWVYTQIKSEFSVAGHMEFAFPLLLAFRPNQVSYMPNVLVADLFRVLLTLYFIGLNIRKVLTLEDGARRYYHLYSFQFFGDLLLITIFFGCFGVSLTFDKDQASIFDDDKYYDFNDTSTRFDNMMKLNAWGLLIVLIRFISVFRINLRHHLMLRNIEIAMKNILVYLIMIVPVLISFSVVAYTIWGPYLSIYRKFDWTFLTNFFFAIGVSDPVYLSDINVVWTILFYIVYLFFIVFFFTSAISGIYMDAYRMARFEQGYREDTNKWGLWQYLMWFTGFLPSRYHNRLFRSYLAKEKPS